MVASDPDQSERRRLAGCARRRFSACDADRSDQRKHAPTQSHRHAARPPGRRPRHSTGRPRPVFGRISATSARARLSSPACSRTRRTALPSPPASFRKTRRSASRIRANSSTTPITRRMAIRFRNNRCAPCERPLAVGSTAQRSSQRASSLTRPSIRQTRVAYDARRVIAPSDEYDFALRKAPKKIAAAQRERSRGNAESARDCLAAALSRRRRPKKIRPTPGMRPSENGRTTGWPA